MKFSHIALLLALLANPLLVHAETSPDALIKAKRFIKAVQLEKSFPLYRENTTRITTNILASAIPEVANNQQKITETLNNFQRQYILWENLEGRFAEQITTQFSAKELDEISTFFESAVGKKYLASSSALTIAFGTLYKEQWDLHKDKILKSIDDIVKKPAQK